MPDSWDWEEGRRDAPRLGVQGLARREANVGTGCQVTPCEECVRSQLRDAVEREGPGLPIVDNVSSDRARGWCQGRGWGYGAATILRRKPWLGCRRLAAGLWLFSIVGCLSGMRSPDLILSALSSP